MPQGVYVNSHIISDVAPVSWSLVLCLRICHYRICNETHCLNIYENGMLHLL